VKDTLVEVLPNVSDIRVTEPDAADAEPQVEFQVPHGWVPLDQPGRSSCSLAEWVADLAVRLSELYPECENPLPQPAVCMIDELDQHLHPNACCHAMQCLSQRFPNVQFIATAHCPSLADAAQTGNANVAMLRRDGDRVIIENHVNGASG